MEADVTADLEVAQLALDASDWAAARDAFAAAIERSESADALFGLGIAQFWLGETVQSLRSWEGAYVGFRRRPDPDNAALAAFYLCLSYRMSMGNDSAAGGWLGRLAAIVDEFGLDDFAGWVLISRAHLATDAGRPAKGEMWAREALTAARARTDVDLELCALSELGAALVEQGRADVGAPLLDEAMAGALAGEGRNLDGVVLISCRTIGAFSRDGDVRRASQWVRAAEAFYGRHGSPHLYTTCRVQYGGLLFANGRWAEAETELVAALEVAQAAEPLLHAEAAAKLAQLRLAQGRIDEAELLIVAHEGHPAVRAVAAAILLARGEARSAASLVRRRLREIDRESLEGVALVDLLVEALVRHGAEPEALTEARRVEGLATSAASDAARARACRTMGRATMAIEPLEQALTAFGRLEMPYESACTRLLLAQALVAAEREAAIREARGAFETFVALGALRDADHAAAFMRSLGERPVRGGSRSLDELSKRELEVLRLLGEGLSNRDIAERLFITRRTVEHHVASVLAKTGLSGRGAAAAYAVRHLDRGTLAN